jgi:hypothetical protein
MRGISVTQDKSSKLRIYNVKSASGTIKVGCQSNAIKIYSKIKIY